MAPIYLTPAEAANLARSTVATLATLRSRGGGPEYVKRGARVLYRQSDVLAWLDADSRRSTHQEA